MLHLIAANLEDAPVAAQLEVKETIAAVAVVVFESRNVAIKSGMIGGSFAPHERHA